METKPKKWSLRVFRTFRKFHEHSKDFQRPAGGVSPASKLRNVKNIPQQRRDTMRSRMWRLMSGAALLTALALAGAMSIGPALRVQGQPEDGQVRRSQEAKLEGTWRVQVSR